MPSIKARGSGTITSTRTGAEAVSMTPEEQSADHARSGEPSDDSESASATNRLTIPLETLAVLNWLGDTGIDGVEDRLTGVLADELVVEADQVTVGYTAPETIPHQFDSTQCAGARVLVRKPFQGNALVLFPMDSANKAAALMLQRAVDDLASASVEMGRDALTELCNMMVNGFVDEWATLFETAIDTSSPVAIHDTVQTVVHRILKHYDLGLYLTTRLHIPEYNINGTIYIFPGEERFLTKISGVGLEVID